MDVLETAYTTMGQCDTLIELLHAGAAGGATTAAGAELSSLDVYEERWRAAEERRRRDGGGPREVSGGRVPHTEMTVIEELQVRSNLI